MRKRRKKPKTSRRKKVIKIRVEISKTGRQRKITETKTASIKKRVNLKT